MKKIILSILVALFVSGGSVFPQEINKAKLDSLFSTLNSSNKAMGSFLISKNGEILYSRSIGFSEAGEKIPATENSLYRIGSITKLYTAAMVFQLIDEGKISLDTRLSDYFPKVPNAGSITIETLLNHRNGLKDFVNSQKKMEWITEPRDRETLIDYITKNKPNTKPDKKFGYSNSGYLLLAYIIEKVTGESYNENLQNRICSKLGLTNTFSPSKAIAENEAKPYFFNGKSWEPITDIYFPNVMGVGDILSSPKELAIFNEALLGGKLFSEASLASMKTFKDKTFGTGIMKAPFYANTLFGHGGDTYGTHSAVFTLPDSGLTVSLCLNGGSFPRNEILIGMLNIYFNNEYKIPQFKTVVVPGEDLKKLTGVYVSKEIPLPITISVNDNILIAQAKGQASFPLEAIEKNKFKFDMAGIKMEFNPEKKEMILEQAGKKYLYKMEK